MSKWISGNELIEKEGIKSFEFFDGFVAKGLQPYNDLGRLISPSDLLKKVLNIDSLFEECKRKEQDYFEIKRSQWGGKEFEHTRNEFRIADHKYEQLHDIVRSAKNISWTEYKLPDDESISRRIIHGIIGSNYLKEEAEKFGLKPGSKAAESSPKNNEKKKEHWTSKDKRKVQEVAQILYANHPEFNTVKEVATHPDVLEAGGKNYSYETVHKWVSEVAPERAKKPGIRSKS
jgi:hypothetical protein